MNIKLEHSPGECDICAYQDKINKLCEKEEFDIEFTYHIDKHAIPDIAYIPTESYNAILIDKKGKRIGYHLVEPFELKDYDENTDIMAHNYPLQDETLKKMIKNVKKIIKDHDN